MVRSGAAVTGLASARVTGRAGRWAIGGLAIDDRRPGRTVDVTSDAYRRRAFDGIFLARRDFANQSRVGFMVTDREVYARLELAREEMQS